MFNPLACVAPRFQRRDKDEEEGELEAASPSSTTSSTPNRSLSPTATSSGKNKIWSSNSNLINSNRNRNRKKNNPFSTRGLDKFSTLLADLEERRRKIYALVGSQSHPKDGVVPNYVVQFICSSSGDWVPIVVRLRDHNHQSRSQSHEYKHKHKHDKAVANSVEVCGCKDKPQQGQGSTQSLPPISEAQAPGPDHHYAPPHSRCTPINGNSSSTCSKASSPKKVVQLQQQQQQQQQQQEHGKQLTPATSASSSSSNKKKSQNRRPSQYLPAVLVLTLVCLVIFGRSVAILLTSACWYLVPTITINTSMVNASPKRSEKHPSFVESEKHESLP